MASDGALDLLERALPERALVFGSLPGAARDVDLLVRERARPSVEEALAAAGFRARSGTWVRFADCRADAVDLVSAESWRLARPELDALFAEGLPLDGRERLVRPAPHHALLILARRVGSGGVLDAKRRARLEGALAEDPAAWERAAARAELWRARDELEWLRRAAAGAPAPASRRARSAAARARRLGRGPRVVCLSGLDGAGKSTQCAALRDALDAAGVAVEVEWLPIGQDRLVESASALLRRLLRRGRRIRGLGELDRRTGSGASLLAAAGEREPPRGAGLLVLHAWVLVVAIANVVSHRRAVARHRGADLVVFDRFVLDSVVRLRYLYGHGGGFAFQIALLRLLAPRPLAAFFLDVRPETSLARKRDRWSLDDLVRQAALYREEVPGAAVVALDAERPREELCTAIADAVWDALGAR